jgi:hypothetical protein
VCATAEGRCPWTTTVAVSRAFAPQRCSWSDILTRLPGSRDNLTSHALRGIAVALPRRPGTSRGRGMRGCPRNYAENGGRRNCRIFPRRSQSTQRNSGFAKVASRHEPNSLLVHPEFPGRRERRELPCSRRGKKEERTAMRRGVPLRAAESSALRSRSSAPAPLRRREASQASLSHTTNWCVAPRTFE